MTQSDQRDIPPADERGRWAVEGRCAGKASFLTRPRYSTRDKAQRFAAALGGAHPGPQGWRYVVVELARDEVTR